MKTIQKLIEAAADRGKGKSLGNHSFTRYEKEIRFAYHGNIVCYWNTGENVFRLDDCGWKGYSSTTRTLNSYRRILSQEYGAKESA